MSVTTKQIAELADVSRGTVDRVLHNRGRVKSEVAERIRRIAAGLDYQPNMAGQAWAKSTKFKIGIILQSIETPTMRIVNQGVEKAAAELDAVGIGLEVRRIDHLNTLEILKLVDELLDDGVSGFAISPSNEEEIRERIKELCEKNIPVITLNSDVPGSGRLCFIGMDNYRAGQTAAGLLQLILPDGGKVLPLTGHMNNTAHNSRLTGFTDALKYVNENDNIKVLPFQPCLDRDYCAYEITRNTLSEHPDLSVIYVAANGQLGVCKAIKDAGLISSVRVIAFDLTPPNDELVRSGQISLLLDQDAFQQGYLPPILLQDFLLHQKPPPQEKMYTEIRIYTKYNAGNPIKFIYLLKGTSKNAAFRLSKQSRSGKPYLYL